MRVDLKSIVLGGILVLALMVITGQTNKPSKPIGRYQIVMPTPDFPTATAFLLDTKTGITYAYYVNKDSTGKRISTGWSLELMDLTSIDVWKARYDE